MSVLIKGMEMPSCNDCPLAGDFKCNLMPSIPALCKEYDMAVQNGKRLNNCPLVEIPPHGRLIDADALEDRCSRQATDEWNKSTGTNWGYAYATFESDVEDAPTIIEAEEEE